MVEFLLYEITFILAFISYIRTVCTKPGYVPYGYTKYEATELNSTDLTLLGFLEELPASDCSSERYGNSLFGSDPRQEADDERESIVNQFTVTRGASGSSYDKTTRNIGADNLSPMAMGTIYEKRSGPGKFGLESPQASPKALIEHTEFPTSGRQSRQGTLIMRDGRLQSILSKGSKSSETINNRLHRMGTLQSNKVLDSNQSSSKNKDIEPHTSKQQSRFTSINMDVSETGNNPQTLNEDPRLLTAVHEMQESRLDGSMEFERASQNLLLNRPRSQTMASGESNDRSSIPMQTEPLNRPTHRGPAPNKLEHSGQHTGTNESSEGSMSEEEDEEQLVGTIDREAMAYNVNNHLSKALLQDEGLSQSAHVYDSDESFSPSQEMQKKKSGTLANKRKSNNSNGTQQTSSKGSGSVVDKKRVSNLSISVKSLTNASAQSVEIDLTPDEMELLQNKYLRKCIDCNSKKPPRVNHCSQCRRCIMQRDHHCPWVANCVGIQNIKFYILFLMYSMLVCTYMFIRIALRIIMDLTLYSKTKKFWTNDFKRDTFEVTCIIMGFIAAMAGVTFFSLMVTTINIKKTGRNAVDELRRNERLENAQITLSLKITDIYTIYKSGCDKISQEIFGQKRGKCCCNCYWFLPISCIKPDDLQLEHQLHYGIIRNGDEVFDEEEETFEDVKEE